MKIQRQRSQRKNLEEKVENEINEIIGWCTVLYE